MSRINKEIDEYIAEIKKNLICSSSQKNTIINDLRNSIATDELNALNKAKEQYGNSLRNQAKYAKIEAENNALKQALNSIRQAIQREIQALEKINHPIAAKVKKSLERLISKNESQRNTDINRTER